MHVEKSNHNTTNNHNFGLKTRFIVKLH